jgi:Ras homolog gene family, member A
VLWSSEILHFNHSLPYVLVGNKKDLRHNEKTIEELQKVSQKPVTYDRGVLVAKRIGAVGYVKCSAKTNEGIRQVFELATRWCFDITRGAENTRSLKCVAM